MLVGLMAIFDFVAEQTANDDYAKVQLVRKKTSSAFVKTAALQQVATCWADISFVSKLNMLFHRLTWQDSVKYLLITNKGRCIWR